MARRPAPSATSPSPAVPSTQAGREKKLLGLVHAMKKRGGLADDEYRDAIEGAVGVRSCASLPEHQLYQVLVAVCRLGGQPIPTVPQPRRPIERLMRHLWHELHARGGVEHDTNQALNAWIKAQTGKPAAWLSGAEENSLADRLRAWVDRLPEVPDVHLR